MMLYHINTTACAAMLLLTLVLGRQASAQAASPDAPSAVQTMAAYDLVEPWIRDLRVADDASGPDIAGACVTLRLRGRVVGRGVAIGRGAGTLPDAARLAIDEARDELVTVNDAAADERARIEALSLTIALELSGAPVPIDEPTYTHVSASISPGTEAVAVQIGAGADAVFPLEMLATGQQAGSAMSRIVSSLVGDPLAGLRQPPELMGEAGAGFFRLRTTAVAQTKAGGRPVVLYRGGRLVELPDVATTAALRDFAFELAGYLDRTGRWGAYLPTNSSIIEDAIPATAALRGYALARAMVVLEGATPTSRRELERAVREIGCDGPASCALEALARIELGMEPNGIPLDGPEPSGRVERAIVAYALARAGERDRATEIVAELRRVDNAAQLVGVMPWLGWAEQVLGADGEIPSAVALRQMRDIVTDFQLTAADAGTDNLDLVGGVVFTSGSIPLPTWQTARPAAFLASMLGDARLTEVGETDAELASVLNAVRFLRQLSASEVEGFMYREPAEAIGGIRASTWDQTMPTDASAMTLLVVLETLESLDLLAEREGG